MQTWEKLLVLFSVTGFIIVFGGIFLYAIHELVQTEVYLHRRKIERAKRRQEQPNDSD